MRLAFFFGLMLTASPTWAADPCVSGLAVGQRPGPYSFLVSVGAERGTGHCFICETVDRPAVIVFARSLSDPLGRLVQRLDKATLDHKDAELRSWVTFLHDDQLSFDPQVVQWAKKQAIRNVSLGVFEDLVGPPSYKLHRDADVTVLVYVKQKVVANFAFRAGELTDGRIAEVLKTVPRILPAAKK